MILHLASRWTFSFAPQRVQALEFFRQETCFESNDVDRSWAYSPGFGISKTQDGCGETKMLSSCLEQEIKCGSKSQVRSQPLIQTDSFETQGVCFAADEGAGEMRFCAASTLPDV